MNTFPHYLQLDAMDCGPTCLRMIARYYGKNYSLQTLRERSFITREGVSMLGISDAAESIGFRTSGVRITLKQLEEDVPLPCILHWNQNHFVVCYDIRKKRNGYRFHIADPASQNVIYTEQEMKKCWLVTRTEGEEKGTALALEPAPEFYEREDEKEKDGRNSLSFFFKYLLPYKRQIAHLLLGMLAVSLLQLIFPFLTQSLVDVGIRDGNLGFITLILIAQLVVSVSQLSVEFIRSWILLHMNTRINISLISDFLIKLMKLPLRFFDTRMIGDIMQRIGDHNRIESFLTGSSVATLFSFVNFFIFGWILACYNPVILGIFLAGNTLYVCWVLVFMKYRRELDIRRFAQAAGEQSSLIQLVTAMQEIKLNNCEKQKRWQWERIQVKLFKISIRGLALGQVQQTGSVFFNRTTNIIISFIAAKAVALGEALKPEFKEYQKQIVKNAQALCKGLQSRGIKIVSDGTDNHLMLVDLTPFGLTGKSIEKLLDAAHITANKNTIPNDPQKPFVTSGIRLGTPAATSRGLKEDDFDKVAEAIAMIIKEGESAVEPAKAIIKTLTDKYPLAF